MGISVIIITYNEQNNIKKCLESVKWADEIIIVDSGSKDKTLDIVKKYTDKIYIHKWRGYSKDKNFGISKAKNEWILSIDSDEIVSDKLKREIIRVIKNTKFDGFFISRKVYFLNKWIKHCGWYPDYQLRLFKRSKGRFDENKLVHEHVKLNGRIGYLKSNLLHFPYKDLNQYFQRFNKYTTLSANEMYKEDKKGCFINLMLNPFFTFFKMYFLKLGFLDGFSGFVVCFLSSFYNFVKYSKLWELTRKK
ncbi:MAG: glycosyltransferase family 2 protein [Candidatus Firestonebacteria bacterium]